MAVLALKRAGMPEHQSIISTIVLVFVAAVAYVAYPTGSNYEKEAPCPIDKPWFCEVAVGL
jgi:hypothetical protein